MTVADLIAWLETQPKDALVHPIMHCAEVQAAEGHKVLHFNYRNGEHGLEYFVVGGEYTHGVKLV